ncbi:MULTISPECIES: orotidine-5'-phosphate decarboxylase [Lactobacillus]|uniref:Orotidine 5'-phosphate decarboxylase n=1 Tax=Lactobacillus xujianguonis TaxID=2495899 RepID=A0A437SXT2_9LACO|nr:MULTISPECIES: orotidine-5'-phosphate decarboxylase [Lactobacillus]RVU71680.1 orotidine-5'-phosphate decarboxylase [Lactobacillus xujianguonis]RVU77669.1 orotidine-5'-phosphate decarboxylase [Lactobacillus xujianguonis]
MEKPVFVALDVANQTEAETLLQQLGKPQQTAVKVGMELFYHLGNSFVEYLTQQGYQVFLDLKLHDIPNTVYHGAKQLAALGIQYTTVHALGGSEMIKATKDGLIDGTAQGQAVPKLLAVTELTSISDEVLQNEQNCRLPMKAQVISLAKTAKKAGADGVICSPLEVQALREQVGDDFLYITPGIRLSQNNHDDQTRIATPAKAKTWGASGLVVGRPITQASNPSDVYQLIKKEFN